MACSNHTVDVVLLKPASTDDSVGSVNLMGVAYGVREAGVSLINSLSQTVYSIFFNSV